MATDRELIDRVAARDQEALQDLYHGYFERLSRFAFRVTRDTDSVVEIINDTFLVVWNKAGEFRGDSSVSTWIIGIVYKKALKSMRRRRRFEGFDVDELGTGIDAIERQMDLQKSIEQLSPQHRAVLELTYYFGYSYREIAELVGCPENTVKTRMYHARRTMRALLETKL